MKRVSMSRSNFAANLLHHMDWKTLNSMEEWENAIAASHNHPIVVFKHSSRCSVSRMALKMLERRWDLPESTDAYFLDLLEHRDISSSIESKMGVQHQSPQMLCIRDGKSVYHANHGSIDPVEVKPYL